MSGAWNVGKNIHQLAHLLRVSGPKHETNEGLLRQYLGKQFACFLCPNG